MQRHEIKVTKLIALPKKLAKNVTRETLPFKNGDLQVLDKVLVLGCTFLTIMAGISE